MRKFFYKVTNWTGVLAIGLVLGISLQFAQAWTEPTEAPPEGNVHGPLTVGPEAQTKEGGLIATTMSAIQMFSSKLTQSSDPSDTLATKSYVDAQGGGGNLNVYTAQGALIGKFVGIDEYEREKLLGGSSFSDSNKCIGINYSDKNTHLIKVLTREDCQYRDADTYYYWGLAYFRTDDCTGYSVAQHGGQLIRVCEGSDSGCIKMSARHSINNVWDFHYKSVLGGDGKSCIHQSGSFRMRTYHGIFDMTVKCGIGLCQVR